MTHQPKGNDTDCKGHSGNTWMLNERAYETYLEYSRTYQIPIVCSWVNLETGFIYYDEIPFRKPINDFMPHDGNKVIKTNNVKHIDYLIRRLRMELHPVEE